MENKTDRLDFRVKEGFRNKFLKLAGKKNLNNTDTFEFLFNFYEVNQQKDFLKEANSITDKVSDTVSVLENLRDYSDTELTEEETQFYKALSLCYDILIKCKLILNDPANEVAYPPEMREEGDPETRYRHAMLADTTADEILKKL